MCSSDLAKATTRDAVDATFDLTKSSGEWHNSDGLSSGAKGDELSAHLLSEHQLTDSLSELPAFRDDLDIGHYRDHLRFGECGAHDPQSTSPHSLVRQVVGVYDSAAEAQEAVRNLYDPTEYAAEGRMVVVKASDPPKGEARPGPGAVQLDAIVAHYTPRLQAALGMGLSGHSVADRWATSQPVAKGALSDAGSVARKWLGNLGVDIGALLEVLKAIYRDAFQVGVHVAAGQLGATLKATDVTASVEAVNWDTWKPGNPLAAALAKDGGLANLLDSAGLTIQGVEGTTLDRLGNALAVSLAAGDNGATTAARLDEILNDPGRAAMIAVTESARAVSVASLQTYADAGIDLWDWLPGECVLCQEMADGSPYSMSDDGPPLHPACSCATVPHVDLPGE